ncbi:MAG: dTDP-4-dehydrorhamnose reductase [Candidatus Moraniibacteriota bacterium]
MTDKKILILGGRGMLGQELVRVYGEDVGYAVAGWDRDDIDVTDFAAVEKKIREYAPDIIINAVAYNAVDTCEESDEEYAKAVLLNAKVPKFLAELAKDMNAVFVHYSSDYVFDGALEENKMKTGCCGGGCCGAGASGVGYDEASVPGPISRYGESKLAGERAVQASGGKFYLIRLSKLFGKPAASETGKRSFFEVMLEKGKTDGAVSVVDDEKSCFTYAPDLAQATKALIEDDAPYGTYHLTNEGAATWYEAAVELFKTAKMEVSVKPVDANAFPRLAKRPKNSTLLNTQRPPLRPYTEALKEFLKNV